MQYNMEENNDKKFWSDITWNSVIRRYSANRLEDKINTFKIDGEYVPLCTLKIFNNNSKKYLETSILLNQFNRKNYHSINANIDDYVTNIKVLAYLKNNKHLVYLSKIKEYPSLNTKQGLLDSYDNFINTDLDNRILFTNNHTDRASVKVIENSCFLPLFNVTDVTKKNQANKKYLTNYFFCAELDYRVTNSLRGKINTIGVTPLYTLVIKKEYIEYVKACMINNIAINTSILELWIDKSLDTPSSEHPIRGEFVKKIRQKCKKDNITIKVFDSLRDELINYPKPISFKSLADRKKYFAEIVKKGLEKERIAYGIVAKSEDLDKTITSIVEDSKKSEVQELLERVNPPLPAGWRDVHIDDIPF